jgi:hypothetical protein
MGYAKYNEDIVDRWVEDTRDKESVFFQQWNLQHVAAPPPPAGEVYLEVKGKRLEDEEVFPVGTSLTFKPIFQPGSAAVEIALTRGGRKSILTPNAVAAYVIKAPKQETVEVEASSGAYHQVHTIHFVDVARIDHIPGVSDEIGRFTTNPPGWTKEQFNKFRARVGDLLAQVSVPQSFADGLVEYFLAVQLEADENKAFRDRLESAFVILRRFAPFSDVAALVAEYFRYRTNTFIPPPGAVDKRPLGVITTFFANTSISQNAKGHLSRGIELVVPEVEYCCLEAVRAMLRQDYQGALGMVAVSRKVRGVQDAYREDRLRIIEARAHAHLHDQKAGAIYRLLLNSPCKLFQIEASQFLN